MDVGKYSLYSFNDNNLSITATRHVKFGVRLDHEHAYKLYVKCCLQVSLQRWR
jgi:hypothetical protein